MQYSRYQKVAGPTFNSTTQLSNPQMRPCEKANWQLWGTRGYCALLQRSLVTSHQSVAAYQSCISSIFLRIFFPLLSPSDLDSITLPTLDEGATDKVLESIIVNLGGGGLDALADLFSPHSG